MSSEGSCSLKGILETLKVEAGRLNGLMNQMLTEVENTPSEQRSGDRWEDFTKRFLVLQASQRAVVEKLRGAMEAAARGDATKH